MEDVRLKPHLGRHERVVGGEAEPGPEEAAAVELAVVRDHQHHLPLVDVVINQAARDV